MSKAAAAGPDFRVVEPAFMAKVFHAFAALALLSLAITLAGKWYGHDLAMGGHTDDTTLREVVIGNNVIAAPANTIRFQQARRDGVAARLDLYLRYPQMDGYNDAAKDDFNNAGGSRNIVFLGFEPQMMSRDMSGRFEPIYSALIVQPGAPGPGGTTLYDFSDKSGYLGEVLAVAERPGTAPFVARCLSGPKAGDSLAPCERDVLVGDGLSLTYRFPRQFLGDWRALDDAVMASALSMLRTAAAPAR